MPKAASRVAKLTVPYLRSLEPEATKYRVTDEDQRTLKFVVEPSGRKYWSVRYVTNEGKNSEAVLGDWPAVPLEEARRRANARREMASGGGDPAEVKRKVRSDGVERRAHTFEWLSELYVSASKKPPFFGGKAGLPKAETTLAKEEQYLRKHINPRLGAKPLADIKRRDIVAALEEIAAGSGNSAANSSLETIRRVFAYGRHKEFMENNPALEIPRFHTRPRDRVAETGSLKLLWVTLEGAKADRVLKNGRTKPSEGYFSAAALQLSLLTLQRRGEVVRIRRTDVDFEKGLWTIPAANKKERRKSLVPLSAWASTILQEAFGRSGGEWAFPGRDGTTHIQPKILTRFMARLRDGVGGGTDEEKKAQREALADITPHDLRRTGRTRLTGEELQIDEVTAERVLNHRVGSRQQNVYDWNTYITPKRNALDAWADELKRIVHGEPPASKVSPMRRPAKA
jgi:integrase